MRDNVLSLFLIIALGGLLLWSVSYRQSTPMELCTIRFVKHESGLCFAACTDGLHGTSITVVETKYCDHPAP